MPTTMFDKVWDEHVITPLGDETDLMYVDRHILHEMTALRAFADLRKANRRVRRAGLTLAVQDHILSTEPGRDEFSYDKGTVYIQGQRRNCEEFGVALLDIYDAEQGIVHMISPELGFTLPGLLLVCGDSHTCTNGGLGALALGIGTSDITHVLATQTLPLSRPKTIRLTVNGELGRGVYAKDLILYIISELGAGAGNGYAVEYAGPAVSALSIEARMTLCNMSAEWGARIGMVAPDEATCEYLVNRRYAPKGANWDRALEFWRTLPSDPAARFDREEAFDASLVAPQVTWGTSPMDSMNIDELVPDPTQEPDADRRDAMSHSLEYMGLEPGMSLKGLAIDDVFIGSCTNSRISDLRAAAGVAKGRKVAPGVRAMVVPGSYSTKQQAEKEGLDVAFKEAGFEWRESACSMCAAANAELVSPKARCVSTSNRNYEGRQGRDARTHLVSPAMAAAAAVTGRITDVRELLGT